MRERRAYRQGYIWEDDIFEKLDAYPLIEALRTLDPASDIVGVFNWPDLDGLAVAVISGMLQVLHRGGASGTADVPQRSLMGMQVCQIQSRGSQLFWHLRNALIQ